MWLINPNALCATVLILTNRLQYLEYYRHINKIMIFLYSMQIAWANIFRALTVHLQYTVKSEPYLYSRTKIQFTICAWLTKGMRHGINNFEEKTLLDFADSFLGHSILSSLPLLPPTTRAVFGFYICHFSTLNYHCIAGAGLPIHMNGEVLWEPKRKDERGPS